MGRAIEVDNRLDKIERKLNRLETAFEGLASTVESLQDVSPTRKPLEATKVKEVIVTPKVKKKKLEKQEA